MIKKSDTLGKIIEDTPEVIPVLAQAGLHCIGCHVSAYESVEDGCKTHGMSDKEIDKLVKKANSVVKKFDTMSKVSFSESAIKELVKRKATKKFVKIVSLYGNFDFEAIDNKENSDVLIKVNNVVSVLVDKRTERMLRGVKISYSEKEKDFEAKREKA